MESVSRMARLARHAACCRTPLTPAARYKVWKAEGLRQGEPAKRLALQLAGRLVQPTLHIALMLGEVHPCVRSTQCTGRAAHCTGVSLFQKVCSVLLPNALLSGSERNRL